MSCGLRYHVIIATFALIFACLAPQVHGQVHAEQLRDTTAPKHRLRSGVNQRPDRLVTNDDDDGNGSNKYGDEDDKASGSASPASSVLLSDLDMKEIYGSTIDVGSLEEVIGGSLFSGPFGMDPGTILLSDPFESTLGMERLIGTLDIDPLLIDAGSLQRDNFIQNFLGQDEGVDPSAISASSTSYMYYEDELPEDLINEEEGTLLPEDELPDGASGSISIEAGKSLTKSTMKRREEEEAKPSSCRSDSTWETMNCMINTTQSFIAKLKKKTKTQTKRKQAIQHTKENKC